MRIEIVVWREKVAFNVPAVVVVADVVVVVVVVIWQNRLTLIRYESNVIDFGGPQFLFTSF